ncbi:serine proteinase inhibitor [Ancylostoma caninum]|uniref:Serine proteinase inhibitor n=1 Tax=Ancylostoma caninum TaxID=29170 RepID=A0A368GXR5_ANCCA|nr:serine proteinase inhibitor [Ancylostoma caninum]
MATAASSPNDAFLTAETNFGLNMLHQVPATHSAVFSPVSVIFALAMVQAGAKGKTKTEINEIISKGAKDDEIVDFYSGLSKDILNAGNGVKTRIANGFFLDKRYTIEDNYATTIKDKYSAEVQALDFSQAKAAAKTIDGFVSNATAGKINDFVTEDTVRDAFSIIINAIYFTADWEYPFYTSLTKNLTFYSSENDEKEIEFLRDSNERRLYAEDEDMEVLSLRYKDTSYALNIFLPKERFALQQLRKKLSGDVIQKLLSKLQLTYMSFSIPKMKIETELNLRDALMTMGVNTMFSDMADLTGITESPPLKVTKANHKAIIEVDEKGTTAAAATSFKIEPRSRKPDPAVKFIANHPFIFILTMNNNPLFIGHFV